MSATQQNETALLELLAKIEARSVIEKEALNLLFHSIRPLLSKEQNEVLYSIVDMLMLDREELMQSRYLLRWVLAARGPKGGDHRGAGEGDAGLPSGPPLQGGLFSS